MLNFFSINHVAFTVLQYPMSYVEFLGTIFYIWSVWLIAQKKMLTWPVGIVSVILYAFLFYQIRLYSDFLEQLYYLGASVYGWWFWDKKKKEDQEIAVVRGTLKNNIFWLAGILIVSGFTGLLMGRIHLILPKIFPQPADFPFWDAFTTISSFAAMFLLARKRFESWLLWIVVDVIGIVLYYVKGVKFLSLLYVFLLLIALKGFLSWRSSLHSVPNPGDNRSTAHIGNGQ
ncbi:nicotinamide riboside transporter PnuC [Sediminispirochaeta smaragdinae]|uniref:Nicotinamide riboside transporter PnuC n=1 Tax=Sediminispirochaeta smaragdinae (strain DSM 11293 / JCM 15392 / SEBR 4228) TaxID=573413 RepID=E1R108_SEDSS|nr:nicotinamide riboside transporter PnuC [Sediminispirochaeta smaragdinae]ADK80257.1 nicotinamide mononucleotide transporter PnuC [Sediminispirochaeta smaragdinae DSM 11293]